MPLIGVSGPQRCRAFSTEPILKEINEGRRTRDVKMGQLVMVELSRSVLHFARVFACICTVTDNDQ